MKKILALMALPVLFAVKANAAFVGIQADYSDMPHSSVAQFKSETDIGESSGLFDFVITGVKADEKEFILQGNLQSQINADSYIFADDTGTIVVDINANLFNGRDVTPQDTIMVYGEAEYGDMGLTFDVDRLRVVKVK